MSISPPPPRRKAAVYSDPARKPDILPPDLEAVPGGLREHPRWVLWRLAWKPNRHGRGKWDKVPVQPDGRAAKTNDPRSWATFEAAAAAYRAGGVDGVGFVLGDGFAGVDLDDVRDPAAGALTPDAAALLERCGTHAEVSPSGTGVKLIGRGEWPPGWHRRPFPGGGEVEGYSAGRYFTVTGRAVGGYPVADIQLALGELAARLAGPSPCGNLTKPDSESLGGDDEDLVRRASAAANGAKFRRLWEGDATEYGGDESRADLALCGMLTFWCQGDAARVDRLFRRSGLMRPKWDQRRGGATYGERTVGKALAGKTEFYDPGRNGTVGFPRGSPPGNGPAGAGGEVPTIVIGTDEYRVNAEAAAALGTEPDVYQRAGMLVQVVAAAVEREPMAAVRRPPGVPVVRDLSPPILRERLSRCARWVRGTRGEDGETAERPAHPPAWCVAAVHARGDWPSVRRLEAVVTHPVLLGDGSILSAAGYDPGSGLLVYTPPNLSVTVPESPTRAEVLAAADELLDVVCDFPFGRPEHRAAWVASLLTPLAWFAFDGPAPLFLIDKNVRGAGAGLLADVVALAVTGRRFPVMAYTPDRDELRKRITSLAAEGERLVLLDNLAGAVGNDVLDAALTSDRWKDRLLGANRVYDGPLHVCWYGTGNNVQLHADTARRVCHVRMETEDERPELRTGFRYPNLRAHVRAGRGRLLSAALTVLRGWVAAGRPSHGLAPWGSFEGWSGVVREAVVFAGLPDPGETRQALQSAADRDAIAMSALLAALEAMGTGPRGVTTAEIIDRLRDTPDPAPDWYADLRGAVEDLCGKLDGRALGGRFRHFARRNFGGRMLDKAGTDRTNANRWAVVPVGSGSRRAGTGPASPASPAPPASTAGDAGLAGPVSAGAAVGVNGTTGRRYRNDDRPHDARG